MVMKSWLGSLLEGLLETEKFFTGESETVNGLGVQPVQLSVVSKTTVNKSLLHLGGEVEVLLVEFGKLGLKTFLLRRGTEKRIEDSFEEDCKEV